MAQTTEQERRAREFRRMLGRLVVAWRQEASGHYCQTYNRGMGDGYRRAASALENVLVNWREVAE